MYEGAKLSLSFTKLPQTNLKKRITSWTTYICMDFYFLKERNGETPINDMTDITEIITSRLSWHAYFFSSFPLFSFFEKRTNICNVFMLNGSDMQELNRLCVSPFQIKAFVGHVMQYWRPVDYKFPRSYSTDFTIQHNFRTCVPPTSH